MVWALALAVTLTAWIYLTRTVLPRASAAAETSEASFSDGALVLLLPIVAFVSATVAVVASVRCAYRYWRLHRFNSGHPSRRESAALATMEGRRRNLSNAYAVLTDLAGPRTIDLPRPWGINLAADEHLLFHGPSHYARYYATSVTYSQSSGFFVGSATWVATGVALTAASNRSRQKRAARLAAQQWRELQTAEYLVTDRRVLVHRSDGQWLSFYLDAVATFQPVLSEDVLFLEFGDTEPLRIEGPAAPFAAVVAVWKAHGTDGLRNHPALEPLRHDHDPTRT